MRCTIYQGILKLRNRKKKLDGDAFVRCFLAHSDFTYICVYLCTRRFVCSTPSYFFLFLNVYLLYL